MDNLHVALMCVCGLLLAGVAAAVHRGREQLEIAVHTWAGDVATQLAKAGLSATVVKPLQALAAGDVETSIGAGIHLAEYLRDYKNWEKEFLSQLQTALADPVLAPKVKALCNAIASGADADTVAQFADDVVSNSPLVGLTQTNQRLRDAVEGIVQAAKHPELAGHIDALPNGQKFLAQLLVAGKALGAGAVTSAPLAAVGPLGPILANLQTLVAGLGNVPTAAAPAATPAPTVPPAGTGVNVGALPDGHSVTVSAAPVAVS